MPDSDPPDIPLFSNWRSTTHECRLCGYTSAGEKSIHVMTSTFIRVDCPACTFHMYSVPLPSEEEIVTAADKGIASALIYRRALTDLPEGTPLHSPLVSPETLPLIEKQGKLNFSISVNSTETWLQLGYAGTVIHREVLPVGTTEPVQRWINVLREAYTERCGWVCMWNSNLYLLEFASATKDYEKFIQQYAPPIGHHAEHRQNGKWDCLGENEISHMITPRQSRTAL